MDLESPPSVLETNVLSGKQLPLTNDWASSGVQFIIVSNAAVRAC